MWTCRLLFLGARSWDHFDQSDDPERDSGGSSFIPRVYGFIIGGWPSVVDPAFAPFKGKRDKLTTQQDCILWGTRVVGPSSLQEKVLQQLLHTHPGISRTKVLARSYVWRPNIDSHVEWTVPSCNTCQSMRSALSIQLKVIPGFSQHDRGPALMWTLLVHFLVVCIWLLMSSVNSKSLIRWHILQPTQPSQHYVVSSVDMGFLKYLLLTMVLSLPRGTLNNSVQTMAYCIELQRPINRQPTIEDCQYSSIINRTAKRGLCQFHAGNAVLARSSGREEK